MQTALLVLGAAIGGFGLWSDYYTTKRALRAGAYEKNPFVAFLFDHMSQEAAALVIAVIMGVPAYFLCQSPAFGPGWSAAFLAIIGAIKTYYAYRNRQLYLRLEATRG